MIVLYFEKITLFRQLKVPHLPTCIIIMIIIIIIKIIFNI